MQRSRSIAALAGLSVGFLLSSPPIAAQTRRSTMSEAKHIVERPARDVGVAKRRVPPVLQRAEAGPYSTARAGSCAQIVLEVSSLDDALGPDFGRKTTRRGSKLGSIAKLGGTSVIDSLIPFRGVVRQVSGAAAADRRFAAAVNAGYARRGFLHGLYAARSCGSGL